MQMNISLSGSLNDGSYGSGHNIGDMLDRLINTMSNNSDAMNRLAVVVEQAVQEVRQTNEYRRSVAANVIDGVKPCAEADRSGTA